MKVRLSVPYNHFICFLFSCFLSLGLAAQNQVIEFDAVQLITEAPAGWILVDEEGSLELSSPNNDIMISFQSFPESELAAVLVGLEQMIGETVSELKPVSEPDVVEINGLQVMLSDARGKMDGIPVQIGIFLVPADEMVLLILGIARSDSKAEDIEGLDIVIGNLRRK